MKKKRGLINTVFLTSFLINVNENNTEKSQRYTEFIFIRLICLFRKNKPVKLIRNSLLVWLKRMFFMILIALKLHILELVE